MSCVFDPLTWEASVGIIAVVAASFVGLKQMGIAKQQANLLDLQTTIQANALREQLFDRRWMVYDAAIDALGFVTGRNARGPDRNPGNANVAFGLQVDRAQFLFPPSIEDRLNETRGALNDWWRLSTYPDPRTTDRQKQMMAQHREQLEEWLKERAGKVPELFGDELRLAGNAKPKKDTLRKAPAADFMKHPHWIEDAAQITRSLRGGS